MVRLGKSTEAVISGCIKFNSDGTKFSLLNGSEYSVVLHIKLHHFSTTIALGFRVAL